MRKTSLLQFILLIINYLYPNTARSVAFAEAHALQRDAGHYKTESLPGELVIAAVGILAWHLERASFQTLLIKKKAVGVPPENLHRLPVLGKEHEYIPIHRRHRGFRHDKIEQRIDTLAHTYRMLAHEVTDIAF